MMMMTTPSIENCSFELPIDFFIAAKGGDGLTEASRSPRRSRHRHATCSAQLSSDLIRNKFL